MNIEVWRNLKAQTVNKAAADWIIPAGGAGEPAEPWVFVVGRDGRIIKHFDNVAGDEELAAAVSEVLATP